MKIDDEIIIQREDRKYKICKALDPNGEIYKDYRVY